MLRYQVSMANAGSLRSIRVFYALGWPVNLPTGANNRAGLLREVPSMFPTITRLDNLRLGWIH